MKGPNQVLRAATLWRREFLLSNYHTFSTTSTLVPKNSRKCHVSVVYVPRVLYVPSQCLKVRHEHVARGILLVVLV